MTTQTQDEMNIQANLKTLEQWVQAARPSAPNGYIVNDQQALIELCNCVESGDAILTFTHFNNALVSPKFQRLMKERNYVFFPAPWADNGEKYEDVCRDFLRKKVPSLLKDGNGMHTNLASKLAQEVALSHLNHFTPQTLWTSLLKIYPNVQELIDRELGARLTEQDKSQRAQDIVRNTKIVHGQEAAPETQENEFTARHKIGSLMQKLIESGYRDFAATQDKLIKDYLREPKSTMVRALAKLEDHTREYTALKSIERNVQTSHGKTSGQIYTNKEHLETVVKSAKLMGLSAVDTAIIVEREVRFIEGSRGITGDPRGRKVEYDVV